MLIGEYKHTIDTKKRVALPAKFRKELGRKVVITHGLDNCLFLYPIASWKKVADKLGRMGVGASDMRSFNRFILAGAVEVDVDSMGRILVPDFQKSFAGLKNKVVFTGVHDRVEIWDERKWETYKSKVQAKADELAEKLGELGAL